VTADIPHTYVAYGTVVESTISLSELLSEASDKDRETTAGVSVIEESLPRHPDGLNSEAAEVYTDSSEGLRIFRLDDGFFLVYRGIGTLRIQPDRISVSQEATASRADIRWLVVSLGLRLALVQRGVSFFTRVQLSSTVRSWPSLVPQGVGSRRSPQRALRTATYTTLTT